MPDATGATPADRVVEVYSAANAFEAHELCAVLEEEGIRAQIVGESLGTAAGCLPLGEVVAPKLWVWEHDATRARAIIDAWVSQPHEEWIEGDEAGEPEEEPDEEDAPPASVTRSSCLGHLCMVVGAVCFLAGAIWGGRNWMIMYTYPAISEGVLTRGRAHTEHYEAAPSDENIPGNRQRYVTSVKYDLQYGFVVDGKHYVALTPNSSVADRRTPVHYDPQDPERNVVGPLPQPWIILVSLCGPGALLWLIGYRCGRRTVTCDTE
jgi:hypothetical protein